LLNIGLLPLAQIGPVVRVVLVLAVLATAGCSVSSPSQFRLNREDREPDEISRAQAEAITETLEDLFGTPDVPKIPTGIKLEERLLRVAAGAIGGDALGKQRGLYRQHCVACHGLSGGGAGPTAGLLNPYPRDFRQGIFKYTSTCGGARPVRADLMRTLLCGVPDTAMPSFAQLPQDEIDALLEYVKYLSLRGQAELYVLELVVDEDEYIPLGIDAMELIMEDGVLAAAELWEEAESMVVSPLKQPNDVPRRLADSIAKGRQLYADKDAQCVQCHGPEGMGDGEETELYDDWNKPKKGVSPDETKELARLFTLPIQRLRPRNFHQGTFRGGARSIDVYWRIHVGIKGTPMPAAGPAPGASGVFAPEDIWHVVDYVRSLSG